MSEPVGTFNDGGIKFVRQGVTALDTTGDSTTYIVSKGSMKAGTERVVQKDANGNETKQAFQTKIRSGSLDLQFIGETDKPPARNQAVALLTTIGSTMNVIIAEVDDDFGAGTPATVKCTVYEQQASQSGPLPG